MAVKIKPLRKFTTGVPSTSDMEVGELAVNTADKKIYMRDNTSGASSIVEVANASGSAADDITTGNAAVNIATTTGNITIDAQGSDTDIVFKGNDGGSTITALTLDMSEAGKAIFNAGASFSNDVAMAGGIITSSGQNLNLQADNNKHAQIKDPSGNIVIRADKSGFAELRESGNIKLATNSTGVDITGNIAVSGNLIFEGATSNTNETTLTVVDPTADRTITLPDATGTVALTSQIPTVPTNASIHLKPHFVKVSNVDSGAGGIKYIKVATIDSSSPSTSNSTFVFRILLEGRSVADGASQFRVHIRTGESAANSSVVVEQEHSNRHTYYGADSFIFLWNSQNNSEFWVKLPNNGSTSYQELFAKLEVSASVDTTYVSGHDDVTIHTSQAWQNFAPSGTNQITAEWIKKRFDSIIFEGSTTNNFETFLQAADPTADRTITLPDATGQVVLSDGAIDTNASAEIGRAHVGHIGYSDMAGFSHVDQNSTTTYSLLQDNNGKTYVNSASGQEIDLRINNTTYAQVLDTGVNVSGTISSDATINKYGSTSAPITFTVTVATQTSSHPYNGDGSPNKYSIDGVQGAALTLHGADATTSNSEYIYRFDQSDNSNTGHPLRFYLEADKTTPYTTGVTTNGTPGQTGAYTQIAVTRNTPKVLYYQCNQHGYMGNYVTVETAGGPVVDDTSPQLGGNLDGNSYNIQLDNNDKYQWGQTAAATYILGNSSQTHTDSNIQFWLQSGSNQSTGTLYLQSTGIMMPTNMDIRFEGSTSDEYETILTVENPTVSDKTITLPNATGTVLTTGNSDTPTTITSSSGVLVLVDDSGTMKKITPANLGVGSGGGTASDSFKTIAVSGQSDVVADSSTDTLTLVGAGNISITTNASNDTITFTGSGSGGSSDSFKTIAVSGQSDVVADSSTDTLTLVAGNNMTITTNASGDEISFAASGGAGSGISEEQAIAFAIVYG